MALTPSQAKVFYDRFGKKQDAQAFYEDAALDELVAYADFEHAMSVFEFGCGTGRFAQGLLEKRLPATAVYIGSDISRTMTALASQRLSSYRERALVVQSDGSIRFPFPDHSVERVVSTYVADLLSEEDICEVFRESGRVLVADGKLCIVSLSAGITFFSRLVAKLWSGLYRLRAQWVGGCRPIRLVSYVDPEIWLIEHHAVVVQFGISSEILICSRK